MVANPHDERLLVTHERPDDRTRVLLVSPYFPPRRRVGSLRAWKLVRHWPEHGIDPAVLALRPDGHRTEVEEACLREVPLLELTVPFDRTESRSSSSQAAVRVRPKAPKRADVLDRLDSLVPVDTWWPAFVARAPQILRFAREFAPDVVVGTADPWSSLLVTRWLGRRLGVPYIADFRDAWTLCDARGSERPAFIRGLDARFEARVVRDAAAIVFTSEGTADRYRQSYGALARRIETIPNGFEWPSALQADTVDATREPADPEAPLVLLFFGVFRPLAPARPLIEGLAVLRERAPELLAHLRIESVGGLDAEERAFAEQQNVHEVFHATEAVPYEQAYERQRRADALLVVTDPRRPDMLPAKLLDALPTGRPVLAATSNPDVLRVLERTGTGRAATDAAALASLLESMVRAKQRGESSPLAFHPSREGIASYEASSVAARYAKLIREVRA